jgi:hypothetical protein
VATKFASSSWGKRLAAREAKAAQGDFERFKAAIAKSKKNRLVRKVARQLAKSA